MASINDVEKLIEEEEEEFDRVMEGPRMPRNKKQPLAPNTPSILDQDCTLKKTDLGHE